jgi:hypothetical protein
VLLNEVIQQKEGSKKEDISQREGAALLKRLEDALASGV